MRSKVKIKITRKDMKNLIYAYENCNILKPEYIRKYMKPTMDKMYKALNRKDDTNETR